MRSTSIILTAAIIVRPDAHAFAQSSAGERGDAAAPLSAPPIATLPIAAATPTAAALIAPPSTPLPLAAVPDLRVLYQNGRFALYSRPSSIWVSPSLRTQIDAIGFVGNGVSADGRDPNTATYRRADVHDGILVRRAQLEFMAGALDIFAAQVILEAGTPVPTQNTDPPAAGQAPQVLTAWVNAKAHPLLQFMIGQMFTPFSLDARTAPPNFDTPETAMMVRSFAAPTAREVGAMIWGLDRHRAVDYTLGLFAGDGASRSNRDNLWDLLAHLAVRPLIWTRGSLRNIHLGGSLRYGQRGLSTDYPYPAMSTPGGYVFFKSGYASATGPVTIVPDGEQFAVAGELSIPIGDRFEARGEVVYVANGTREMAAPGTDPTRLQGDGLRAGRLHGLGFYGQIAVWPSGAARINGWAGAGHRPLQWDPSRTAPAPMPSGLQVLARVEALDFEYDADARSGSAESPSSERVGHYAVWGLVGSASYWFTPHFRLTAAYEQYFMSVRPPTGPLQRTDNHALGPSGPAGPVGTYGELIVRCAVSM